jgi:hypothetical protein
MRLSTTVGELREKIASHFGLPPERQFLSLTWKRSGIPDSDVLPNSGIEQDTVLHLIDTERVLGQIFVKTLIGKTVRS